MKYTFLPFVVILIITVISTYAQKEKIYRLSSPGNNVQLAVTAGKQLQWAVTHKTQPAIIPSNVSLTLQNGDVLGNDVKITLVKTEKINKKFAALHSRFHHRYLKLSNMG